MPMQLLASLEFALILLVLRELVAALRTRREACEAAEAVGRTAADGHDRTPPVAVPRLPGGP
jgi:hypothetical protein